MKLLILGHPRCGSKFSAYYLNLLGLKIMHENQRGICLKNYDGLSSWAFTVKHNINDKIYPRWGLNGDKWRKNYKFEKKIVHIRNPFDSFNAIINENNHRGSYSIRTKYIYNILGQKINGNKLERAILCYLYWYEILLNDCDFYFRIEYDLDKLNNYIKNDLKYNIIDIDIDNINKKVNTKNKIKIKKEDFMNVNKNIMKKLNNFCMKYDYYTFDKYFQNKYIVNTNDII